MMNHFDQLFNGWIAGTLSEQEINEFLDQVGKDTASLPVHIDQLLGAPPVVGLGNVELRERLYSQLSERRFKEQKPVRRLFSTPVKWAAAVLIIMAGAWWYHLQNGKSADQTLTAQNQKTELPPGGDKAVLVLGNGSKIILDNSAEGQLAQQQDATIYKSGIGQIVYKQTKSQPGQKQLPVYNTLRTPRGGQYRLELPDGTTVWLNAASSITYPTAFIGTERVVKVEGEAYFEVAKDKTKPFQVEINNMRIVVLGTHFNVNAYDDEPSANTTLMEGSVKLKKGDDQYLLQPGQQAQLDRDGALKIVNDIDPEQILAWKNGFFSFRHTDLKTVMRQIARWYNVTIEYRGEIPDMKFGGDFPRSANAETVLKILEESKLHFTVEGKKIIVMP